MIQALKIVLFAFVVLAGTTFTFWVSPLLTFLVVSFTGWAWMFHALKWIILFGFWGFMYWRYWPKLVE